ncbi:hypothetical protein QJS10_CPB17g00873 [Acorus calamus]|uniref:Uncharacterized protein n=1 Tax=Acorus calamus TaxID=4465 RepID=A0AAV9CR93_ACOCL|nr:hypothetical protein QJS10_CPB17g00873 [Acorus calamus]
MKSMEKEGVMALRLYSGVLNQIGAVQKVAKQSMKPEVGHFRRRCVPWKRKLREFSVTEEMLLPVDDTALDSEQSSKRPSERGVCARVDLGHDLLKEETLSQSNDKDKDKTKNTKNSFPNIIKENVMYILELIQDSDRERGGRRKAGEEEEHGKRNN